MLLLLLLLLNYGVSYMTFDLNPKNYTGRFYIYVPSGVGSTFFLLSMIQDGETASRCKIIGAVSYGFGSLSRILKLGFDALNKSDTANAKTKPSLQGCLVKYQSLFSNLQKVVDFSMFVEAIVCIVESVQVNEVTYTVRSQALFSASMFVNALVTGGAEMNLLEKSVAVYFVGATALTIVTLASASDADSAVLLCLGPIWNFFDGLGAVVEVAKDATACFKSISESNATLFSSERGSSDQDSSRDLLLGSDGSSSLAPEDASFRA